MYSNGEFFLHRNSPLTKFFFTKNGVIISNIGVFKNLLNIFNEFKKKFKSTFSKNSVFSKINL